MISTTFSSCPSPVCPARVLFAMRAALFARFGHCVRFARFPRLRAVCFVMLCSAVFAFRLPAADFLADYVRRAWTAADGLPGNTINDIIQDNKGYIYLGTYDGLVRFDGVQFSVINRNTNPDFKCVSARVIFEDSRKNLWVGSNDEGVARFSDGHITMITAADGLPGNSIRSITEDKDGAVWIGTADGVAVVAANGTITVPQGLEKDGIPDTLIVRLYCDTAGRVWASTSSDGGLYYFSGGRFVRHRGFSTDMKYAVTAIAQDSLGGMWFGTNRKTAFYLRDGELREYGTAQGLVTDTINCILQSASGAVWFGSDAGIAVLSDGAFSYYTEADGLTNNRVTKIIQDREENMWITTDRGGVEKLSTGKFRTVTTGTTVNCLAEDLSGSVWAGTDDGLLCFRKNAFVQNRVTEAFRGLRVRHIALTGDGSLLVSTYSDKGQVLITTDGEVRAVWNEASGLTGNRVRVALEDSRGDILIGTTTGLNIANPQTGASRGYTRQDGLSYEYIMCLYEDSRGRIWIGTDGGGIMILENGAVTGTLTTKDGLAGNVIFKITEDKNGVFWICTGTGLSRYDGVSFFNYNASNGLGTDSVFQMLIDYTGMCWMTSNNGISAVPLRDIEALAAGDIPYLDVKFFNKNDGLRSAGVTSTSVSMVDSIGRLWFTLIDGFAVYDPLRVRANTIPPLVHIESMQAGDTLISPGTDIIRVPAGEKRIVINYTGLSYVSPEKVRFRYRLEGFDSGFSQPSAARFVSYTNLKPGKYTFSVSAANGDGLWSPESASVVFVQEPFLYQRTSFWVFCVLVLFSLAYFIYRFRVSHLKAEQLRLERMVRIKTEALESERDNSDKLLLNILPRPIAQRLKANENDIIADTFPSVSVLFADIVNFTKITSELTAEQLVRSLNDLFSRFDVLAAECGVEKIKTIGDAYMAVCGLPEPREDHSAALIRFACRMYDELRLFNGLAPIPLHIRIGINSGPVMAGVIGKSKFIYDLWGDTVNVASRMESLSRPDCIHVSQSTMELAREKYTFVPRGAVQVKGKGEMETYYVKLL